MSEKVHVWQFWPRCTSFSQYSEKALLRLSHLWISQWPSPNIMQHHFPSMSQLSHTGEGAPSITMTRAQCWQPNGITLPAAPADSAAWAGHSCQLGPAPCRVFTPAAAQHGGHSDNYLYYNHISYKYMQTRGQQSSAQPTQANWQPPFLTIFTHHLQWHTRFSSSNLRSHLQWQIMLIRVLWQRERGLELEWHNLETNKFALLWGEAQKKIAYSYPRVTYSYHKVT